MDQLKKKQNFTNADFLQTFLLNETSLFQMVKTESLSLTLLRIASSFQRQGYSRGRRGGRRGQFQSQ